MGSADTNMDVGTPPPVLRRTAQNACSIVPHAMSDIEAAWEAVHEALDDLPSWEATRPQWRPDERLWATTAFYAGHLGRFAVRPEVELRGLTEAEALWELAAALRAR